MKQLKLRPHHLICTLGYEGKGYSDSFAQHMDQIVTCLCTEKDLSIQIVNTTDDICAACPNKISENLCAKEKDIKAHDKRVFDALQLKAKTYPYETLKACIRKKITAEKLCEICGECMWLPLTQCRKLVLNFLQSPQNLRNEARNLYNKENEG